MFQIEDKEPVAIKQVRYIKLGAQGGWARECFRDNIVRLEIASR
jgi:hypothetical protein